jgi:glycosyltransferase involved in cell wall biosynthesis
MGRSEREKLNSLYGHYRRARSFAGKGIRLFRAKRAALVQFLRAMLVLRARASTERRLARGTVRTLWASTPILTLPILAECDKLLGLRSSSLVFNTYYITRSFDINLILFEGAIRLTRSGCALRNFRRLVLAWAILKFDVFHYFYDRGLMISDGRFGIHPEELQLLFDSGKRLYTYAYGADVRSQEITLQLGEPNICAECPQPGRYCICKTEDLNSSLVRLEGRVTARIAMGDMVSYVPGCRNMHYWPLHLKKFKAEPPVYRRGDTLRVAHAPNHGHFKGTRYLTEAIEKLRNEGHSIELVSVQGVPNERVIELFMASHLIADQFIAGFHGYTALEAMALARPVLCFLRNDEMMIDPATCPIINVRPEQVYDVLKRCLKGEIDLESLGKEGREYIDRYYSVEAVAARLGRMYIETAGFSEAVNRRLQSRVDQLERNGVASGCVAA